MFGTIDIRSRPLKIGYLVDPNDARQVRDAIGLSCSLWGGSYSPIIPLFKRMPAAWSEFGMKLRAENIVRGYIEAFDPDVLVQISKSLPSHLEGTGLKIVKPEQIWKVAGKEHDYSPQFGIGIFELLDEFYDEHFKYKKKKPVHVTLPKIPKDLALFWTSWFGEFPPNILAIVKQHYTESLEIAEPEISIDDVDALLRDGNFFPRRISAEYLKITNRARFGRDACIFFLDASNTQDIIDFWNLRASGRVVLPLPKQFQNNPVLGKLVVDFLRAFRRPWRHNPSVCDVASIIRARSCTMDELQAFADTLHLRPEPNDPCQTGFVSLQHWYPRIWDEWARDRDGATPVDVQSEKEMSIDISDDRDARMQIRPLLPKLAARNQSHHGIRCANEFEFRFYDTPEPLAEVLPKSSGPKFIGAISGLMAMREGWRVGRHGLVKLVSDSYPEPRELPLAELVFSAWMHDLGWEIELSSSGILAKQINKRMGSGRVLLQNEKLLGLLEHMSGGSVKRDGSAILENKVGPDRDVSVGEVKSRLQRKEGGRDLHDYLVAKGIFKLGLRTQCPECRRNTWFPLESIRDSLNCPLCLNSFPAVGHVDHGAWSYKTTGPFSVPNYADGAYGVLITLNLFTRQRISTLRVTPMFSFVAKSPGRKGLEADFALFWQDAIFGEKKEGLLFGECKSFGLFEKKDFERMRYLAKSFPGAILVFSTLRKSLTANEITAISRIAKSGRKLWKAERPINPVLVLTGNELFHWAGPPTCWSEPIKKKLSRDVSGLLSLCDATQQIYLNLPSWQENWHQEFEKKHAAKRARQSLSVL